MKARNATRSALIRLWQGATGGDGAALGNLLGPVLAGRAFDQLGGYGLVIGVGMALSVLATVASARVVTPRAGAGGRG
jgi:hypothetical protein